MKDKSQIITVPCPACGSDEHRSFCSKRGLDFVECVNCDTVYGSPRPTSHRLNQYYREATCDDYWNERIYPASETLAVRASSSLGSKGFDVTVMKEKADTITPEHLNYFHPDSLVKLVESVGLKTIDISTPGKLDVDIVRKKVEPGIHSLDNDLFLKRIIIDKYDVLVANFLAFLSSNRLSSHKWLVARKED